MRKTVLIICIFVLLSALFSCKEEEQKMAVLPPAGKVVEVSQQELKTYVITYTASIISNTHVGNEWRCGVKCGEMGITSGRVFEYEGSGILTLQIYALEKDDREDDYGGKTVAISDLNVGEEQTITEVVEVVENGGRYTGNSAYWEFSVSCKRV